MSADMVEEPPAKRQRLVVRIKHFVVSPYDQALDYKKICESIYDGGDYLCVKEVGEANREHVHFQGTTSYTDDYLKIKTSELITQVHRVTADFDRACEAQPDVRHKKPRPVRWSHQVCNNDGYCYMSKEQGRVVLATTFTEAQLKEFAVGSDANVKKIQTQYNEAMWKCLDQWILTTPPDKVSEAKASLKEMSKIVRVFTLKYYERELKPVPFNILDNKIKNCLFYWKKAGVRVMPYEMF